MSVFGTVDVLESELWPQRDARDPLGIFGWRVTQVGDATGGANNITVQVPAARRHAYVYKIYDMLIAQTTGSKVVTVGKLRILANWPNIDTQAGIQAYGALFIAPVDGSDSFTVPKSGFLTANPFNGNTRDILIFDPSTQAGNMAIAEQEVVNIDTITFSFEGYGYYWDRSAMAAPGGPRNPGTS